jgi:hypothetical protein
MDLFLNRFLKNRKEGLFIWLLIIFSLSLTPGNYIPKVGFSYTDLIVHFVFYSILSTLAYFSYIFKNNLYENLLKKNILIIGQSNCFGSGCLGKYGINSNTSAEGFVRLICQNNKNNTNKAYDNDLSPNKNRFNKNPL